MYIFHEIAYNSKKDIMEEVVYGCFKCDEYKGR